MTLAVTADRAAIESAVAAALDSLKTAAPASDLSAINRAISELALARDTSSDAVGAISHVMKIFDRLTSVSTDTTAARRAADRLLLYWQSRV